jgi:membrane fusion protein, multidrug efflux system
MRVRAAMILTTLAGGLLACGGHEAKTAAPPDLGPPRAVVTVEVERTGDTGEVAVPGVVQARRQAALSARIPASVTELPYREGQRVESGAVVVRLDDAALRAAVAAAEAGLKASEADLERTKTLLEKNAATPRELEQMTAAVAGARAQVTGARDNLSYAVLRAPFAGRIASRRVNLGDVVNPGMPLVEIEGQGGLEIQATVESGTAAALRPGSRIKARVDGQGGPLDATITAVAPSGDATTHRFEVKADLPAAPGLRAGLFARLLVPGLAATPRLTVPAAAVFERGGLTGLFVVEDGTARLRWVAAGAREGDTLEIRAGVEEGEPVVLGPEGLVDGAPVKATPRPTPDGAVSSGPGDPAEPAPNGPGRPVEPAPGAAAEEK